MRDNRMRDHRMKRTKQREVEPERSSDMSLSRISKTCHSWPREVQCNPACLLFWTRFGHTALNFRFRTARLMLARHSVARIPATECRGTLRLRGVGEQQNSGAADVEFRRRGDSFQRHKYPQSARSQILEVRCAHRLTIQSNRDFLTIDQNLNFVPADALRRCDRLSDGQRFDNRQCRDLSER